MVKFYRILQRNLFLGFFLIITLKSGLTFSQSTSGGGTEYFCEDSGFNEITMIGGESCNLNVTLTDLIVENPRCANQSGYIHMDVSVADNSGNPVIISDGFVQVNGINYDLDAGESFTEFFNEIPVSTGTYTIQVYINAVQGLIPNCTNFIVPQSIECCNDIDISNCMIDSFAGEQQIFNVVPDYEPIEITWDLYSPPCDGLEGEIQITSVSGGGCSDPSQYNFNVNSAAVEFNTLTLVSSDLEQLLITATCTQGTTTNLDDCEFVFFDEFEFSIQYDQSSEVTQVSCPGEDDGQILIDVVTSSLDATPLQNAKYTWYSCDENGDNPEFIGVTSSDPSSPIYGEQSFSNGIIGNGNILTNLPGSATGNFYYVVVRDNNDPPCIVADWIDDPIAVYEPEEIEINTVDIQENLSVYYIAPPGTFALFGNPNGEGCDYNVSCPDASDGIITIELNDITGGDFPFAGSDPNIPSESDNYENYSLQLQYQDGTIIGNWTGTDFIPDIQIPNLAAGNYQLTVQFPSGNDEDGDGIGDGICEVTETITLTPPPPIELFVESNNDEQYCFGDSNGSINWINPSDPSGDFITGGCPYDCLDAIYCSFPEWSVQVLNGFGIGEPYNSGNYIIANDNPYFAPTYLGPFIYADSNDDDLPDNEDEPLEININQLPAGNYVINVIDALGCPSDYYSIEITEPDPIIISDDEGNPDPDVISLPDYNGYEISCFGANDGWMDVSVSEEMGTPPFEYQLTGPSGYDEINGNGYFNELIAGTYTISIFDSNYIISGGTENCAAQTTVTLTEPDELTISANPEEKNCGFHVSCFGGSDGIINTDYEGGISPYQFAWEKLNEDGSWSTIFGENNSSISNLNAGFYAVTIEDLNSTDGSCLATDTVEITEPTLLEITDFSIINVSCFEGNDGEIDITIEGGCQEYTFEWQNSETGEILPSENLADLDGDGIFDDAFNLYAGNYTVLITDNNSCIKIESFEITEPDPIVITPTSSDYNGFGVSCFNGNNGFIDIIVEGGTGEYTYEWEGPDGYDSANQNISTLEAGIYSLIVTDENDCSIDFEVELIQPEALSISLTSISENLSVACYGECTGTIDINVNGGVSPFNYSWSNGETSEDISELCVDDYTIIVTDSNGCIISSSFEITEPELLTVEETVSSYACGYEISCNGANNGTIDLEVEGGTGEYSFSWTGSNDFTSTEEDLIGLEPGLYSVIVTDEEGCPVEINNIEIAEPEEELTADLTISEYECGYEISCFGANDASIDLLIQGGNTCTSNEYIIQWVGPNSFSSNEEDINNLEPGTYQVLITDAEGCTFEIDNIEITEPAELTISEEHSTFNCGYEISCNGASDGWINISVEGGNNCQPYIYNWTGPNGFNSTDEDLENISDEGIYSVEVTDIFGCSVEISVEIDEPDELTLSETIGQYECGYQISCFGATDASIDLLVEGGCEPYIFTWNNSEGFSSSEQSLNEIGIGTYSVTVTDDNGCTVTIPVIEINGPDEELTATETTSEYECGYGVSALGASDGFIDLDVSGGSTCESYTFNWNGPSGFTSENQNLSGLSAGIYSVVIIDVNGCLYSIPSIEITEPSSVRLV